MNYDDLFLQRRMKRVHSTQHARDNKEYTDDNEQGSTYQEPFCSSSHHAADSVQLFLCYAQL